MMAAEAYAWYILAAVGMIGSAVFSGLETGIYTLNRVQLHVRAGAVANAAVLQRLADQPDRLLGTLLVGNNIANYMASLATAALLTGAGYTGWGQVAINAAILTPALFVFGEVLPKDLFRNYSDRLTYPMARPLDWFSRLLRWCGVLPLIGLLSGLLQRLLGAGAQAGHIRHPRRVVTELIKEGVGHGVISLYQSDMVDRVLQTDRMKVHDVMVPWKRVVTVRSSQPPEAAWALADRVPFARLPIEHGDDHAAGVLTLNDVLRCEPDACPDLMTLARPVVRIEPDASLHEALLQLQLQRSSMGLVFVDAQPVGLVTTKDLVEPIVGELDVW